MIAANSASKKEKDQVSLVFFYLVPEAGIEPARLFKPRDFKSLTSTYFVTRADFCDVENFTRGVVYQFVEKDSKKFYKHPRKPFKTESVKK